ncbi:serine-rich coiled-coil domain-containing protein 2 isoform X2 [Paramormyrops kingsleyae]|uniref:serine-rich coiled-coil domain-containing protein 2 isoform X2 n=1 Tax=Paramormyrops kingsleyae TaxID=1676925 RepID=UPI000CD5E237|nr:serine-rich coiled-coil domain-containing protein 2-like isoform X2 [Paramormyrops kingsleyae]
MEEKAISTPTMVSRLPKFGVRPEPGLASQPHGSGQSAPSNEGKGTGLKRPNGMVRIPSFSLKWKKEGATTPPNPEEVVSEMGEECKERKVSSTRELKKPSTVAAIVQRQALATSTTNGKPAQTAAKADAQPAAKPTASGKLGMNGVSGSGVKVRAGSGLPRPKVSSGSAQAGPQLSDSLQSLPPDPMVRSQSFSHFNQSSLPIAPPMTRSFSFNKAVELAKPPSSKQTHSPMPLKSGLACGRGSMSRLAVPSSGATPTGHLKKPLLPGCALSRPTALGFRLPRPSLIHIPRPLLAGKECVDSTPVDQGMDSIETPLTTSVTLSDQEGVLAPKSQLRGDPALRETELTTHCLGDRLEDMSLSSASSLEHNDTSEEYLDDFDNLGDGGGALLLPVHGGRLLQPQAYSNDDVPDNRQRGAPPVQGAPCSFLSDDHAGGRESFSACPAALSLSPVVDIPHASSLELSPSNSSGGIYMWDEEGLEPLGPSVHLCGSYDSDVNSMDILNNLDNLESCDLDDDDLMLDADLPEDGSLCSDADRMSQAERSERGGRQGHWRRRQHRWNGPDHFHNDNSSGFQPLDGYHGAAIGRIGPPRQKHSPQSDGHMVGFDESMLRHMAQDCSSVKSQLLRLKNLLQMENGVSLHNTVPPEPPTPEPSENFSSAAQVEDLRREVQELKEELRRKEKTIAQLTQQLSSRAEPSRCHCQQRALLPRTERRTHHDKATQTPWRGHAPQILQSSNPACRKEHLQREKLPRIAPTEDPSDGPTETKGDKLAQGLTPSPPSAANADSVLPTPDADELSLLLSMQLKINDPEAPPDAPRATGMALVPGPRHPPIRVLPTEISTSPFEGPLPGSRPRILQSPRFHSRVCIPTLVREAIALPGGRLGSGAAGPGERQGSVPGHGGVQLPPPSWGLPSFSYALQASSPVPNPPGRTQAFRHVRARCPEDAEGNFRHTVAVSPSYHSRLPKPKTH